MKFSFLLLSPVFLSTALSLTAQNGTVEVLRDESQLFNPHTIGKQSFAYLENQTLNEGFENGHYWFKVTVPKGTDHVVQVRYAHVTDAKLFSEGEAIAPIPFSRYLAFPVASEPNGGTYYLHVNFEKEAYAPIHIESLEDYHINVRKDLIYIGFYYGIVFAVILFHAFHFFNSRNKNYIYYMFMLVSLTLTIGYRDGLTYLFFGQSWLNDHIEPFFNLCVVTSLIFFTKEYLQLEKYMSLKLWYAFLGMVVVAASCYVFYLVTSEFALFVLTEDLIILLISAVVLTFGILMFKKSIYTKFYLAAYLPMLVLCWNFYNSAFFGYEFMSLTIEQFRLSGIIEMVVFTFAVTYQAKVLNKENRKLREDLLHRDKELTTFTLQMIEKNTGLLNFKDQLSGFHKLEKSEKDKQVRIMINTINATLADNVNWDEFKSRFEKVNDGFYDKIVDSAPDLTNSEVKLAALMKLKLSSKDAAALLNITERSVVSARSRLRKKLNIGQDQNMYDFFSKI